MKFLTSIGPSRIPRQQLCIRSWQKYGGSVTAVQSAGESAKLRRYFPRVEFVETDLVGDVFDRPFAPRIAAFFPHVTEPAILINSDIQVNAQSAQWFNGLWSPEPDVLKVGIRWDHSRSKLRWVPQRWGIDAFLLTPEFASRIPDIGMTIGVPCWDYWLPWHCVMNLGMTVQSTFNRSFKMLMHETHQMGWGRDLHKRAMDIFEPIAKLAGWEMDKMVQEWTGRTGWTNR